MIHGCFRCAHHLQLALSAKTPPTKGPTILSAEISQKAHQQTLPPPGYPPRDPPRRSHISVVHRATVVRMSSGLLLFFGVLDSSLLFQGDDVCNDDLYELVDGAAADALDCAADD